MKKTLYIKVLNKNINNSLGVAKRRLGDCRLGDCRLGDHRLQVFLRISDISHDV